MSEKKKYVVGFLFSEDRTVVALIRKNRPDWQKGRLNGIGGKVEDGETYLEAMVREFEEETGVVQQQWDRVCTYECNDAVIVFFKAFSDRWKDVKTVTDEEVALCSVSKIGALETIYNLNWLVPLCLDPYVGICKVEE